MTAVDVVVIVAGLLFGYRLVSNYLSPKVSEQQRPRPESDRRNEEPRRQEWQRNWEPPKPNWFDVLGVPEHAEWADIERAYRLKISQYHPDKVAQMGEDIRRIAETKSKEVNAAYEAAAKVRRR
ncbi:J domain-containing protein [Dyella acidisoli]|uniref:J domain-containing protein n=1 Tax=Dyella acidisoli TaxID=1867834 RepID=A0ABQ5XQ55_9GAMM|nr:J domain-containing protein [Dyella acidisoli]GLQ93877.1 hypothetical protein GCM10007901_28280 [Dyella acidisoli]